MSQIREVGKERYGLALVLILSSMVVVMAAPDNRFWEVVILCLQAAALFASLRAAQSDFRLRVACGVIIGISLAGAINLAIFNGENSETFVRSASLLLVVLATPVIALGLVRQVKQRRQITIHTMMGVLCIYMLMGVAFASSFALIHDLTGDPFFRQGDGTDSISNYLYFSLTTITTAGLGDFAPADKLGRSLTALEALIGQIYLVTVVAVIVSNLGRKRPDPASK